MGLSGGSNARQAAKLIQLRLPGQAVARSLPAGEALQMAARARAAGQWEAVLQVARQIVRQQPRFMGAWLALFDACHGLGQYTQLEQLANDCLRSNPRAVAALVALATALRLQQRHEQALPVIEQAIRLQPADAGNWNHLGILQKEMGLLDAALSSFNRCVSLRPDYCMAYWNRSDLLRQPQTEDIAAMQRLLASGTLAKVDRARLHYALARAHEFLGQDAEQFQHVSAGAQCKRETIDYDHPAEMAQMARIEKLFNAQMLDQSDTVLAGPASDVTPIFICGLPRSGTTLTEQILSSHTQVTAGDELLDLPLAVAEQLRRLRCDLDFPDWAAEFSDADWRAVGQRYLVSTRVLQKTAFFTDKNLHNYKAIGVIHRALPQAKIIYCERDPMDTLWGCYRQLFGDGLSFTYSQEELADTCNAAAELMRYWEQCLPGRIHRLRYEELVADQEAVTRRLLDFVGLPWEPACLEFYRNPRAVRTTSATQVREPLSTARSGQWRKFESQLEVMRDRLHYAR